MLQGQWVSVRGGGNFESSMGLGTGHSDRPLAWLDSCLAPREGGGGGGGAIAKID